MFPMKRSVLFVCLAALASAASHAQIETAEVTGGRLQGSVANGVASFKGIPFAAPPVGENRWRAPQPIEPWSGLRPAVNYAPSCMQAANMVAAMGASGGANEDCLYLNVWTAAESRNEQRPVMVWIYGGGFAGGMTSSPVADGTGFAEKGVVLVSIAYRIGPFGFMAHSELSMESGQGSGNYGLQDMLAGLAWVRNNIDQFGGDPNNVTIFGESAGAIAVSMLTVVPDAAELFHRAISQSGGSFGSVGGPNGAADGVTLAAPSVPTLPVAEAEGARFLQELGVENIQAARALDAADIQSALPPGLSPRFWPVADGHVLPGDQYELYEAGQFNDTPILIGTNSDEGGLFVQQRKTPEEFEAAVRAGYGDVAEQILDAYPHSTSDQAFAASRDLLRDSVFAWHTWAWASLQSQHGNHDAYLYYFDHRTPASPNGAGHAADIPYVFGTLGTASGARLQVANPSPADYAMSDLIMSYWVNFAASGDPNGRGLPAWPKFTRGDELAMVFDANSGARRVPNLAKLEALDHYYRLRREGSH